MLSSGMCRYSAMQTGRNPEVELALNILLGYAEYQRFRPCFYTPYAEGTILYKEVYVIVMRRCLKELGVVRLCEYSRARK